MNKLKQFLENFALDYVLKYLQNNKADVIKTANSKLDLPILNEKQEKDENQEKGSPKKRW